MLISGVHFEFFFHQKKRNYKLSDYKKFYRRSQLRFGEITKKRNVGYLPTPLGHLSVKVFQVFFFLFFPFYKKTNINCLPVKYIPSKFKYRCRFNIKLMSNVKILMTIQCRHRNILTFLMLFRRRIDVLESTSKMPAEI